MSASVALLPEDLDYLDGNHGKRWSIVSASPGKHALMIRQFSIPSGFNREASTLMVLLPSGYPGSALDMFYFDPPLARSDGVDIGGLAPELHFERSWQRWSRHYAWEAGEDSLAKHVEFVIRQLCREVRR